MTLSLKEFAALGGKARWKGISKKKRSEQMKRIRTQKTLPQGALKKRAGKPRFEMSTSKFVKALDEQARMGV